MHKSELPEGRRGGIALYEALRQENDAAASNAPLWRLS
jgi:hypothetical protein